MNVLVTGGAGFIGSHTTLEILEADHNVVVIDNLVNANSKSLEKVEEISGKSVTFHEFDLLELNKIRDVFKNTKIDSVIHFAGYKAVGESVEKPMMYYRNNLQSTLNLLEAMKEFDVVDFVFSSSSTVYGDPASVPITEDFPLSATNPYGRTKLFLEHILIDYQKANPSFNIALLRYFNPVGAHPSGKIGEDPSGIPNNLMPYISQVAVGKRDLVSVFGGDYKTHDGTGVRDYIHVVDLAKGHLSAMEKLKEQPGLVIYNLGTGTGYSVLDVIKAFEKASEVEIPYKIVARRPGDAAESYSNADKAAKELGWKAQLGLDDMCADSWRWQSQNPEGFK
ncbi:MAG: UDP-glucose 4-epimerase GalE [Bacteroidota bacterium]